ncbi:receptor-like protein 33 [Pistacia vera]|uniref:receptor-like protein 33 n=1 Tax=Pistacia vera TaxID=55513 RepID=UPI001262DAD5|nr:receptor-like protein 33 [Pistacia vera]
MVEILDLSNNRLSGIIPECMGNFSSLRVLDLRKNRFYGSIPGTFAEGNHYILDLGNKKINDTFPYWLGNLLELRVLVLCSNKFYGSIRDCSKTNKCFPKLRIFDLSNNSFSNFLPTLYFKNLEAMMDVGEDERELEYMGEDYYQDSVILTWKGHEIQLGRVITTCTTIDFSNNYFHGEIPRVIGNLHALRLLNLSHNNLSGCIPSSLGNSIALESLDLSSNKLTGKIPWQLANLSFLQVLNLSQNHLSEPIPQDNHLDTFSNNSYDGNLELCGFPLSQKCGTYSETPQPPSTLEDDAESSSGFGWKVVLIWKALVGYKDS